jgi:hypothetical protein
MHRIYSTLIQCRLAKYSSAIIASRELPQSQLSLGSFAIGSAVYYLSAYARDGGLLSYGHDPVDNFRPTASYVDRILRGAKPAELPVQLPTKFEMIVNLKADRFCFAPIK